MSDYTYDKILHIISEIQNPELMDKCTKLISSNKDKFETAPASKTYFAYKGGYANYLLLCLRNAKNLYSALRPDENVTDLPQLLFGVVIHHIDSLNRYIYRENHVIEVTDIPSREFMLGYIIGRRGFDFFPNIYSACTKYTGVLGKMIKMTSDYTIQNESRIR